QKELPEHPQEAVGRCALVALLLRRQLRRRTHRDHPPAHRTAADATLTAQRPPTASALSFPGLKAEACRAPRQPRPLGRLVSDRPRLWLRVFTRFSKAREGSTTFRPCSKPRRKFLRVHWQTTLRGICCSGISSLLGISRTISYCSPAVMASSPIRRNP